MNPESQTESQYPTGNGRGSDPDAIQADIHRTREQIDQTLHAVEQKLSPGELLQEVMSFFGQKGGSLDVSSKAGDLLSGVARMIKENPVPSALIGIGLLGLARDSSSHDGQRSSLGGKLEHAAQTVGDKTKQAAQTITEKAKNLTEGESGEGISGQIEGAAEKVSDMASDARETIQQTYQKVRHRVEDDPIVLGALGIALGAALGAALPSTRVEDETFGEKSDELAARAKQVGEQLREGAKQVAHEVTSAISGEQHSSGSAL
jgi:hypothetical protein